MSRTVTTQAELDQAIADKAATIYIQSEEGVRLILDSPDSSHVEAWDSSHVEARDSSHVVARDSSHVEARDSSHVEARDSSHVEAWDSSHVEARDSSHVVAWDSSHVVARDSSHVEAWDSSHVEAGSFVAVHLHSQRVQLSGGVVIDMTAIDRTDPQTWCDLHGVKVTDGIATVYKAVDGGYNAGHGWTVTNYGPGSTPAAGDWRADNVCGGGLHFGPTPLHAQVYYREATRFLAVGVALADLRPLDNTGGTPKCKAPRVVTACVEVDRYGKSMQPADVAA